MYPQVFEIRLDDEHNKKYYAGQVIEGRVILCVQKEKIIKGIEIRLIGKGNVYWDTGIKHNHVYSDSEIYFNNVLNLFQPVDGRQTILHPGTFEYFFSIPLPKNIPSSIEGQHCFIRYYLHAAILRPWKDDIIIERILNVTSISDLNVTPEAAEPSSFQKEKHVGFNICQTGPIAITFMVGKTGFVPGEYIQFGVEIRNQSGTRINGVHISLKRLINCHAKGETKSSYDKILQINGPSAEVSGYLLWQSNFEIPMLPPSGLIGCQIISMQYFIEVKLALEKWADVKFNMPIILGTIPFQAKSIPNMQQQQQIYVNTEPASAKVPIIRLESSCTFAEANPQQQPHPIMEEPMRNEMFAHNGIFALPPLDLTFFQNKPERQPHFKSYEDCDCEFSYPYRITPSESQEIIRPPRPHSNPGHFWERSEYWEDDE